MFSKPYSNARGTFSPKFADFVPKNYVFLSLFTTDVSRQSRFESDRAGPRPLVTSVFSGITVNFFECVRYVTFLQISLDIIIYTISFVRFPILFVPLTFSSIVSCTHYFYLTLRVRYVPMPA